MGLWNNIFSINKDRNFGFFYDTVTKTIKFYIPEQLEPLDKESNYHFLKKYSATLKKYSNSRLEEIKYASNFDENIDENNLEVISSYINVLDDYMLNGSFNLFEKFYKKGSKKINWNKTLKENDIIISKNNDIIYNSFYSKNTENNVYHQYYLLYLEALRRAKLLILAQPSDKIVYVENKTEQKYHIYKYHEEHFRDRELFIASNLINIFLNDKWNNYNEKTFDFKYFSKFEHIWEKMISDITRKNKYDSKIKKGEYLKKEYSGLSLFPDHFVKVKDEYFLFDSKFYKSYTDNGENNYPDSKEISKQFLYRYMIAKQQKIDIELIHNFFIFPKNNIENKEPELFDIHYCNDFPELTIFCIAVDVQTVIDYYLNESDYESLIEKFKEVSISAPSLIKSYKEKKQESSNDSKKIKETLLILIPKRTIGFLSTDHEIKIEQDKLIVQGIVKLNKYNDKSFSFIKEFNFNSVNDTEKILNNPSINIQKLKKIKIT